MKLIRFLILVLQATFAGSALGDIQWTSDQAQIISRKNGLDTSSWNVDETKRRPLKRGLSQDSWST